MDLCELKVNLIYRANSRIANTRQKTASQKNKTKQNKNSLKLLTCTKKIISSYEEKVCILTKNNNDPKGGPIWTVKRLHSENQ